jgi:hypothetical protein
LLGGYFHQDCYELDGTDEAIMQEFRKTSWDYQRMGVRADIRRLLHQHSSDLLEVIQKAFAPAITVGSTNEEARSWLLKIEALADSP